MLAMEETGTLLCFMQCHKCGRQKLPLGLAAHIYSYLVKGIASTVQAILPMMDTNALLHFMQRTNAVDLSSTDRTHAHLSEQVVD